MRQFIFTCLEQGLHIPAVLAEHVVGTAQLMPIQADRCQRIQPVTDQPDVRLLKQFRLGM